MKNSSSNNLASNASRVISLPAQLALRLRLQIERGEYGFGDKLLSVNKAAITFKVARDTVEKAYALLRREGLISSIPGKGVFVERVPDTRLRVLLLFNKLSAYKQMVYDGIVTGLGSGASVDLCIHHYDPAIFSELLDRHLGGYHYYVLMPHFFEGTPESMVLELLERIPSEQLLLLDKMVQGANYLGAVFQDFFCDICEGLCAMREMLRIYNALELVFPSGSHHPKEIIDGVRYYCELDSKAFNVSFSGLGKAISLTSGSVYIVLREQDLAEVLLLAKNTGLILGRDIGVISFNDTALKQVLDITVVSTDFSQMGNFIADMIQRKMFSSKRNPMQVLLRGSV